MIGGRLSGADSMRSGQSGVESVGLHMLGCVMQWSADAWSAVGEDQKWQRAWQGKAVCKGSGRAGQGMGPNGHADQGNRLNSHPNRLAKPLILENVQENYSFRRRQDHV